MVARRYIERAGLGRELLQDASCKLESPWPLSSAAHFTLTDETKARRLVVELRAVWDGNDMMMGPARYTPRVGLLKTREERLRDQRLMAMAKTVQKFLPEAHTDRRLPPRKIVCWRSATIVLGTRRVVSLKKDSAEVTFHDSWYNSKFYTAPHETLEKEIRDSMTIWLQGRGRKGRGGPGRDHKRNATDTLTYWTMNCQNKAPSDIGDILDDMTRMTRWGAIALQKVGRHEEVGDIAG